MFSDNGFERSESIIDRTHHNTWSGPGAGLADTLGAEFRLARRRLNMCDDDIGHFRRHRR